MLGLGPGLRPRRDSVFPEDQDRDDEKPNDREEGPDETEGASQRNDSDHDRNPPKPARQCGSPNRCDASREEQDRWALAYYILALSAFKDPLTGEPLQISSADRTALDDPKLVADTPDEAYTAAGKPKRTSAASDTESAEPRHVLVHAGGDAVLHAKLAVEPGQPRYCGQGEPATRNRLDVKIGDLVEPAGEELSLGIGRERPWCRAAGVAALAAAMALAGVLARALVLRRRGAAALALAAVLARAAAVAGLAAALSLTGILALADVLVVRAHHRRRRRAHKGGAADQARGRVPILAGAAEANVRETIRACEYYHGLGVRAVAIVSPYYYKLSPPAVYATDISHRTEASAAKPAVTRAPTARRKSSPSRASSPGGWRVCR